MFQTSTQPSLLLQTPAWLCRTKMTVSGPVRGSLWAHKHVTIPVYVWQVTTIETMRSRLYHSEAHSHSWPYTLYLWRERTLGQVLEAMRCETRHPSRLRDSGHDRESYTNHARNLVFLESHFIESPCVSTGRRTLFGQAPGTLRVLARISHPLVQVQAFCHSRNHAATEECGTLFDLGKSPSANVRAKMARR
jgi:hypothetical protein